MALLSKEAKVEIAETAYLAVLGEPKAFMLFASGKQATAFATALGEATYFRFARIIQGLSYHMYEGYFDAPN